MWISRGIWLRVSRLSNRQTTLLLKTLFRKDHAGGRLRPHLLGSVLLVLVSSASVCGEEKTPIWIEKEVEHTSLHLPSPPEIFRACSKVANPRWRQLYRNAPPGTHRERERAAFALGTLLCDSIIGAEARDAQHVRNSILDIRDCLNLLGLAHGLDQRLPAIHSFAENQNWPALRFEIEALEKDFQLLLAGQLDEDLASLIELGNWLRCLDVCAEIALGGKSTIAIGETDIYRILLSTVESLKPAAKLPFVIDLRDELERLRRRWEESTEASLTDDVEATQEKIRNYLNRTLGGKK